MLFNWLELNGAACVPHICHLPHLRHRCKKFSCVKNTIIQRKKDCFEQSWTHHVISLSFTHSVKFTINVNITHSAYYICNFTPRVKISSGLAILLRGNLRVNFQASKCVDVKILPEAQRTQGIESITQIITHGKKYFRGEMKYMSDHNNQAWSLKLEKSSVRTISLCPLLGDHLFHLVHIPCRPTRPPPSQ